MSGRPDLGNGKNASDKGTGAKAPTEEHVKFQRPLEDSQKVLGGDGKWIEKVGWNCTIKSGHGRPMGLL